MQNVSVSEQLQPPSFLPRKPAGPGSSSGGAAGVISAEADLRDFKKESTSFVPASLQRKKAKGGPGTKIDAAPSLGQGSMPENVANARPDLMKSLGKTLEDSIGTAKADTKAKVGDDEYSKFMEEVGDVL